MVIYFTSKQEHGIFIAPPNTNMVIYCTSKQEHGNLLHLKTRTWSFIALQNKIKNAIYCTSKHEHGNPIKCKRVQGLTFITTLECCYILFIPCTFLYIASTLIGMLLKRKLKSYFTFGTDFEIRFTA